MTFPTRSRADHFAAGLLMPRQLFTAALSRGGDGLDAIQAAAAACATSLTATAIRYAQCAEEPATVIVSSGRSVEYCFMRVSPRPHELGEGVVP